MLGPMIMKTVIGSASILSATLAGFYFAYATVITAQGGVDGADAMRRMNSAVERPPFLALFFLAPLLAVATAVWIVVAGPRDARGLAAVFGAVCAIAACVTTVAINVPSISDWPPARWNGPRSPARGERGTCYACGCRCSAQSGWGWPRSADRGWSAW